ncbi:MAG: GNAT family N-acetyltransferase [Dehalococcoidia bacterium]|nr:GNAT family N-acetyltransferase [Dehalococcoidia bacterium]
MVDRQENDHNAEVSLREITSETVIQICKLSDTLSEQEQKMVAPNAISIAQAHFSDKAWFRAIYADEMAVGFVMLYDDSENPEYFLWRLMIAGPYQGKGYGRKAIELLVEYVKTRPRARELSTSYVPIEGGPEGFYRKMGFEPTGEVDDGEIVVRLTL